MSKNQIKKPVHSSKVLANHRQLMGRGKAIALGKFVEKT
jgi:hypothetical protein